jgi:competence protein ComEC
LKKHPYWFLIYGFNMAILAAFFAAITDRFLPRLWSPVVAILGIAFYTVMVGGGAAVVRAAIMGGLSLFGRQIGRRQMGVHTLVLVAAVMCLFNPRLPWDVGFQLSFAATLGLVLLADPLQAAFERKAAQHLPEEAVKRISGPIGEYFLFTLAAQVTTLPIIAYHFQRFSIYSFLSNILVLPPQPLVMILGGISVLVGLVFFPAGQLLAYIA